MGTIFGSGTESEHLSRLLAWCLAGVALYYLVRIAAALLLLTLGRSRPPWRSAALACAPAALRPALRAALAGGLLTAALSGTAALAVEPSGCDGGVAATPLLDRGSACTPVAAPNEQSEPPPAAASAGAQSEAAALADGAAAASYEVRPGDSLWRIADRLLGPGASPEQVSHAWPQLYRANEAQIGADPDLIRPGVVLQVPAALAEAVR